MRRLFALALLSIWMALPTSALTIIDGHDEVEIMGGTIDTLIVLDAAEVRVLGGLVTDRVSAHDTALVRIFALLSSLPFGEVDGPDQVWSGRLFDDTDWNDVDLHEGIGSAARIVIEPVPEPGALLLLAAGIGLLGWVGRRR